MTQRFLLVDLDGTLVDPAPGIIGSFRNALTVLGHPAPPEPELHWIIGPPLRISFARLVPGHEVERAVALYRETYGAGGLFEATPYDGIMEALHELSDRRLFLCTSKPLAFAERVTAEFGFAPLFQAQYGADMEGTFDDKADLIAHILRTEGLRPEDGIMIGNRKHDTLAAGKNGMRSVGVLWGYGSEEELTDSHATVLCPSPDRLVATIEALY